MRRRMIDIPLTLTLSALVSAPLRAEFAAHWDLDGTTRAQKGGPHGTAKGNPTWTADRYGDEQKALRLDGQDDYVDCGRDASLSFGDGTTDRPFSISAWVKMDKHGGFAIVSKKGEYSLDNNNHFRFCLRDQSSNDSIARSAGRLARYEGKWVHLAATYDGSRSADGIAMYINGAITPSKKEGGGSYVAMERLGGPFTIGRAWRLAQGSIDDVRIYDHVLSAAEVMDLADHFRGAAPLDLPASRHTVTIPRTALPPTIDGDLADATWQQAQWHPRFRVHGSPQQVGEPKTTFATLHDGERVYIAVRADEPEPAKMIARTAQRDGPSWTDDSVEIFLDSMGDGRSHHHFAVNTKGVLYDAQVVRGGGRHKAEWDSDTEAAARVGSDAWFLEVAIPLSCLTFDPDHPTMWRLNVTRSRFVTGTRELFTFAPVQGTFHDTGHFAVAQVADADLTPFLWYDLGLRSVRECLRQGRWAADVEVSLTNLSSHPRQANLQGALHTAEGAGNVAQRMTVGNGKHNYQLTIPLPAKGEATLDLSLQDPESQRIVCSRQFALVLDCLPLKVELLRPHYQNAIFAGQNLDRIELAVEVALDPEERSDYAFELVLKSDRDILRHQETIEAEKAVVSVPLPRLKPGRYELQGRLTHRPSGNTLGQWSDVLRKLPPCNGEVRFDEQGVCFVDNERFLPFGIASDWWPKGIWDAIALGCNAIENCSITLSDGQMPMVDEVHRAGMKQLVYAYPRGFPIPVGRRTGPPWPLTSEQERAIRSHVRKRMHHPAILAWYTGNEPYPEVTPPAAMQQIHDIISEEDPYHPTVIINHNISHIAGNVDAMALVMPDPYPSFLTEGGWARPQFPTQAVREAVRASRGRKPVWAVLQAHDGTLFGLKGRRAPTFADLRNQLHQAAIAGAKGFFWYCRYWIEPHVEIGLKYLASEVAVLREAILAPPSPHEFAAESRDLHLSRRQVAQHIYLFAVSSSGKARDVAFNAMALPDGPLFVVGEARSVQVRGGQLRDSFKPYDTHVYTTDGHIAEQLDIASVLKDIEVASNPPVKPGNLAHQSRGTKVLMSKQPLPNRCPPPDRIIDGSKWSSWRSWDRVPNWVEIVFAQPEPVCRVVIDSNISDVAIQVEREGAWAMLGEAHAAKTGVRREAQTIQFPATKTQKLRVLSRAVKGGKVVQDSITCIWEVEVYGPD